MGMYSMMDPSHSFQCKSSWNHIELSPSSWPKILQSILYMSCQHSCRDMNKILQWPLCRISEQTSAIIFQQYWNWYENSLCYVYTYTDWHTDVTRTSVRIMSLSTGSCSYHIRVMSATVSRAKFVRVDYFETVKITDTDKCPYQIRIASVSCPPRIRVVLAIFVSHPWHILAQIHTRIWQGCDTDTTRTPYGCNTDECWQGRTNNHGRGFDTNVVRVWHGFDADNANTTRMGHGRDTDVTRIQPAVHL